MFFRKFLSDLLLALTTELRDVQRLAKNNYQSAGVGIINEKSLGTSRGVVSALFSSTLNGLTVSSENKLVFLIVSYTKNGGN